MSQTRRISTFSLALILAACSVGSSGGTSSFQLHRSHVSVAASTPIVLGGKYVAFLADEATTGPGGTDMNGDTDKIDSIAVVINMTTAVETKLNVAATAMAWIGTELYLVVDESLDGRTILPFARRSSTRKPRFTRGSKSLQCRIRRSEVLLTPGSVHVRGCLQPIRDGHSGVGALRTLECICCLAIHEAVEQRDAAKEILLCTRAAAVGERDDAELFVFRLGVQRDR
jgi:hypothetical protein